MLAFVWMFVRSRLLCYAHNLQQCAMIVDLRTAAAAAPPAGGSSITGADDAVAAAVVVIIGNDCFSSGCVLLLSLPASCCQAFWLKLFQSMLRHQIVNTSHQLSNLCLSAMNLRTMSTFGVCMNLSPRQQKRCKTTTQRAHQWTRNIANRSNYFRHQRRIIMASRWPAKPCRIGGS
jgi:hypothetical protein